MKRKKITGALILAFLLFVLTSCAGSTESGISSGKAASSSESGKETMTSSASSETEDENSIVLAKVEAEYAIDVSEPKVLRDNVSHVFVARVKSIDGCSNTAMDGTWYETPQTYGTLEILETYKGELHSDAPVFAVHGGKVTIAEFEKDAPEDVIRYWESKRVYAGQTNIDKDTWYFDSSCLLEGFGVGGIYLFFADYNENTDRYVLGYYEYSTRRIKDYDSTPYVQDPDTGEFTPLSEVVDAMLK